MGGGTVHRAGMLRDVEATHKCTISKDIKEQYMVFWPCYDKSILISIRV
jgi:hypothetical protein